MQGQTTVVGVDRRARWIEKCLTVCVLVILLSTLYLILIKLLVPRFDFPDAPAGHMLTTVLIAVLVVPLRNRLGLQIRRLLRQDWQSSQDLLREIGMALSRTIDPEGLYAILVGDVAQRLRLQSATLWMLEPPHDRAFVALGQRSSVLFANGATAHLLATTPHYLFVSDLPSADLAPFVEQGTRLLVPLRVGDRLIGIFGCGSPKNGQHYSKRLIELLQLLAPAAATALENARAYTTIARLNAELRELDQLKDVFIQSVGHELRTPLTSLSLAVQLLARHSSLPPSLAQVARTGVAQLQALVDRVLDFDLHHQPAAELRDMVFEAVELAPLLEEIVALYEGIAATKDVHFLYSIPSSLVAWGDAARLRRALHEVVDNAVRYSEGGTVTIQAMFHDGLAVVRIMDEGPGIPHDERERLFAAFYRGSSTRSLSATPGAGLGLSLARRDIEALGGQIWIERSGPSGSTMCVALPGEGTPAEEQARAVGG